MNVSFIGLGIMGAPMAQHLQQAGYLHRVYNRTPAKMEPFAEANIGLSATPREAAEGADVIITMVSDSSDVQEVIVGGQGLIHAAQPGAIVIDMSSINPEVTKEIGHTLAERQVELVDAPVSGGQQGAIAGTLAIMVGGKEDVVEKVRPVLDTMGGSVVRVGELGAGGYAKLANNIIVALNIQAMSEAFSLAKRAGLDFEHLYQAIRGGLAGSQVLEQKVPHLMEEQFEPGFKIGLHLKDLKNALQAASAQQLDLPFTEQIKQVMEEMKEQGLGDLDHTGLYQYLNLQQET